ncbi:MAG: maleylpyruvate isomerase family mycothiol-dependent enzyme, partial [Actinomycetota bacterium]
MDTDLYLATIRADGQAMLGAAAATGLEVEVPTCPGWTMGDLMVHTGRVHRHKTEVVRGGYVDADAGFPPQPDGDVLEWYAEGLDEMLDVFTDADLSAASWTWCEHEHNADWWVRRMAHETAIHAADALIAAGQVPTIDADLAIDGIDEILDEMMLDAPPWGTVTPGDETVALEAGGRRWGLRTATFSGVGPESGTAYEGLVALL